MKAHSTAFLISATLLSSTFVFAGSYASSTLPGLNNWDPSHISQVTLISGRPDFRLPFVRFAVTDGYSFIPNPELDITTQQLSILSDHGVTRVSMAEIVNQFGATTYGLISHAIEFAITRSPIVTFAIGSSSRDNAMICSMMDHHPQTAFVVAVPSHGSRIFAGDEPACAAPNILRATGLNETLDDLATTSSYGDTVRIAAPSIGIPTTGVSGRLTALTGTTPATMLVTSELSQFSQMHPELTGASLIDQFMIEHTVQLPSLEGKVEDRRALVLSTH